MIKYHKIQTVLKRDPETNMKTLLEGQYSLPEFEYLANNIWVFDEKIDGTNIRILYTDGQISFAGKQEKSEIPKFLRKILEDKFLPKIDIFKELFDKDACLYGEGYGARIQKIGKLYRKDQGFILFDVKIGDWWLKRSDVNAIAKKLGIEVVPMIGSGTLFDMIDLVRNGFLSKWGDFQAEGIVARPAIELKARDGKRVITKLKYKDFA